MILLHFRVNLKSVDIVGGERMMLHSIIVHYYDIHTYLIIF